MPVPARLFVLLARQVAVGLILRRGPSEWTQLIHWDMQADVFTPGQWLKARLYPERCDLSPDGSLFVYFAHRGGNSFVNPNYTDSWTAISKPPYFTALALWPVFGQEYGGGVFRDSHVVWLNHKHVLRPHENHLPQGIEVIQDESWYPGLDVLPERMLADGWERVQSGIHLARRLTEHSPAILQWRRHDYWLEKLDRPAIWHKRSGALALERHYLGYRAGRGVVGHYVLVERRSGQQFDLPAVNWADFDRQGRLLVARDGRIFTAAAVEGNLSLTELADFCDRLLPAPDGIPAPRSLAGQCGSGFRRRCRIDGELCLDPADGAQAHSHFDRP